MSGAVHETNELRNGKEEVEELRNEEEHERLGKVTLDGSDSKGHSGKVGERISDEGLSRIGVEVRQSQNASQEGEHEIQAVHVLLGARSSQLNVVVGQNGERNDDSLTCLQTCNKEEYRVRKEAFPSCQRPIIGENN